MAVQRVCKCGCGQLFTVPPTMPGREYVKGHKPRAPDVMNPGNVLRAKFGGRTEAERGALDYRCALKTAKMEQEAIAAEIDVTDDRIAEARNLLNLAEAQKERLTDRHLTLCTSVEILQALVDHKSVRELANAS